MNIQALIFDGYDELDLIGMFEPLRMADFAVQLRSLRPQEVVIAAHGLKVIPDSAISLDDRPDVLLVPGGGWRARAAQGAWAECERGEILEWLRNFHARGTMLAAVCTGSLLVAYAGLLKNRPATANSATLDELRSQGAQVIAARVVDDGDIITAGGVTSSLDLALVLVEKFRGRDCANDISAKLHFQKREPTWTKS